MKLTERQRKTYELIIANSKENKLTTQNDIYSNYPAEQFNDGYVWSDSKDNHDHCVKIWSDIEAINKSEDVEQIIICDNFKYFVATSKEEAMVYANKYMRKACKTLTRYWNIVRKIDKDGQGKIDFKNALEMEFINTYGEEIGKI